MQPAGRRPGVGEFAEESCGVVRRRGGGRFHESGRVEGDGDDAQPAVHQPLHRVCPRMLGGGGEKHERCAARQRSSFGGQRVCERQSTVRFDHGQGFHNAPVLAFATFGSDDFAVCTHRDQANAAPLFEEEARA